MSPEGGREDDDAFADSRNLTNGAWIATAVWGVCSIVYAVCFWKEFARPDVLGSFLQGVCSPVAFLWLVVGYILQRKELELQRIELRKNNESQVGQMDQLTRQAEFLSEQLRISRARSNADFDLLLDLQSYMLVPGSTPAGQDFRLSVKNLGSTVFNVQFKLESPGNPEVIFRSDVRFPNILAGRDVALLMGPILDSIPTMRLHVTFVRADGGGRTSTYVISEAGRVLTPTGTTDVVIGHVWGVATPDTGVSTGGTISERQDS